MFVMFCWILCVVFNHTNIGLSQWFNEFHICLTTWSWKRVYTVTPYSRYIIKWLSLLSYRFLVEPLVQPEGFVVMEENDIPICTIVHSQHETLLFSFLNMSNTKRTKCCTCWYVDTSAKHVKERTLKTKSKQSKKDYDCSQCPELKDRSPSPSTSLRITLHFTDHNPQIWHMDGFYPSLQGLDLLSAYSVSYIFLFFFFFWNNIWNQDMDNKELTLCKYYLQIMVTMFSFLHKGNDMATTNPSRGILLMLYVKKKIYTAYILFISEDFSRLLCTFNYYFIVLTFECNLSVGESSYWPCWTCLTLRLLFCLWLWLFYFFIFLLLLFFGTWWCVFAQKNTVAVYNSSLWIPYK